MDTSVCSSSYIRQGREFTVQKPVGLIIFVIVAGLCLAVILAYRQEISFYVKLYQAYRTAQRFRADYPHLGRDVAFHPNMEPRLDVYSPAEGSAHPVVVFVHGGSWKSYDKNLFAPVATRLLPENIVVVIPDYTLHPEARYEQMTHEVAAALSWTLDNIDRYGGDPQRVVIAGHSAGAHLAALAIMDPRFMATYGHRSAEICGYVGLSGVYDVQAEFDYWQSRGSAPQVILDVMGGEQNLDIASPIRYVRADLPPFLVIHGDDDQTVPVEIGTAFHAALQTAGAESTLGLYPGSGHSDYLFAALADESAPVVTDILSFVRSCRP
jgi:acetyl esterase/lipase